MEHNIVVGLLKVKLYLPSAHNLKEKRRIVKSLKERIRNRFNVSIAEVDYQDYCQSAYLGIVQVSCDSSHLYHSLEKVSEFIRQNPQIGSVHTEIEHF